MTLTKDYLEYLGITEVTDDGTIFTKRGPLKPRKNKNTNKYQTIELCLPGQKGKRQNFLIHKVVWAWFNNVLPEGMEIHHKDFDPTNNALSNLECLTREEHKERHADRSIREIKCRLDIPRDWYVKKIETSKGSSKHQYKCKLRYFDAHIDEHNKLMQLKRDIELLKYLKKHFKEVGDTFRWHQFRQLELNWESYDESVREKIMTSVLKYCI